jgi:cytochrome c oxidase cbb3-type subunit I
LPLAIGLGGVAFAALVASALAQDSLFAFHMSLIVFMAAGGAIWRLRTIDFSPEAAIPLRADPGGYLDDVIRAGLIATVFWGIVGFLVGVYIALELAFPLLNLDLPWTTFGRLRPLHTSAVVFAFGGNALLMTSFYVVQRTTGSRLWGGNLRWFVFWGYQVFIVLAATGYLAGITQSREYAEPEWYVDLWLTIVWVTYLAVFVGTLIKRKDPHIYVANWFYLAFIITVAMLHVVNNLAIPVSPLGSKSYPVFAGVQDGGTGTTRSVSSSLPAFSA